MESNNEKQKLIDSCTKLLEVLMLNDPQKTAEALALMYVNIGKYVDAGNVSYEAIDCELMKLTIKCVEEGENNGRFDT